MEIGATKAVQERLKTTKIDEIKGASLVFCWDTHLTKIKGRNVLFIVNASNRYTIAMTDIETCKPTDDYSSNSQMTCKSPELH